MRSWTWDGDMRTRLFLAAAIAISAVPDLMADPLTVEGNGKNDFLDLPGLDLALETRGNEVGLIAPVAYDGELNRCYSCVRARLCMRPQSGVRRLFVTRSPVRRIWRKGFASAVEIGTREWYTRLGDGLDNALILLDTRTQAANPLLGTIFPADSRQRLKRPFRRQRAGVPATIGDSTARAT